MSKIKSILEELDVAVKWGAPLSEYTTFQLGGNCKALIECKKPEDLEKIVVLLNQNQEQFILIGSGSNLVVSDNGLDCFVIRYVSENAIVTLEDNQLIVSASTLLDDAVKYTVENGLSGLVYASGIPGTVGGAVVGNAGAFGQQVGDVLLWVDVVNQKGIKRRVLKNDLDFSYRNSNLKVSGDIVLSACFHVKKTSSNELLSERNEILKLRSEKHPDLKKHPCAGSFFRNIEPTSKAEKRQATGWFLEEAGGKSLSSGGAQIFLKHANIIVKGDNCTSEDVRQLSLKMQELVKNKFGIDLVREVRFVGKFPNAENDDFQWIW